MTKFLYSKFETYLLDEDMEIERNEEVDCNNEQLQRDEYPAGFFTSL
ncbi:hypothetical protein [Solibacillus sp. CAU 1738]